MRRKKMQFYCTGIIAMVGMPLMMLIFIYIEKMKELRCIEINVPSSTKNLYSNTEYDTIDYNHPKGNFYSFSFSSNTYNHPIEKLKLYYILKNKPKQFDGIHVDLNSIETYLDYIFLHNQMNIHRFDIYFEYNNNFYCYYNGISDSLYRKKNYKKNDIKIIHDIQPMPICGYGLLKKKEQFSEKLKTNIQMQSSYWYFWILYFLTVSFHIKRLKKY